VAADLSPVVDLPHVRGAVDVVRESLGRLAGGGHVLVWWEGVRATIDGLGVAPIAGPVVGSVPASGPETGLLGGSIWVCRSGCIWRVSMPNRLTDDVVGAKDKYGFRGNQP
jgi:hypothetical protein